MATHSNILAWESYGQINLVGYSPWGHKRVRHDLVTKQHWSIHLLWGKKVIFPYYTIVIYKISIIITFYHIHLFWSIFSTVHCLNYSLQVKNFFSYSWMGAIFPNNVLNITEYWGTWLYGEKVEWCHFRRLSTYMLPSPDMTIFPESSVIAMGRLLRHVILHSIKQGFSMHFSLLNYVSFSSYFSGYFGIQDD